MALDTSVIVAGLQGWHVHHEASSAVLAALLASADEIVVPLPALVEAYSVMTRLPAPHRLAPAKAREILQASFADRVRVAVLPVESAWTFLGAAARQGVAGGAVYDAHLLATAVAAGADRVLTLNVDDFERLERSEIRVISPLDAAREEAQADRD